MPGFLDRLRNALPQPPLEPLSLDLTDRVITVVFRRNERARRMTLRMDRSMQSCVMTVPKRVSRLEVQRFAEKSRPWIEKQLARQPKATSFQHGSSIALRGAPHMILATGSARGLVRHVEEEAALIVPGAPDHLPRRLTDWLKSEARRDLVTACDLYAAKMGVRYSAITVRDQKSRWGSCASSGALSFSWRLVMAPAFVLDYVAAHEVAHLREMNHGPRFWRLVLSNCPHTRDAKTWLKQHGRDLHRAG
jgi:predicted metal-dependent hydrolase